MPTENAPELKTLAASLELKALSDAGEFEGLGSTNNTAAGSGDTPDSYGDVVAPGAFVASLAKHKAAGTWPAMLWHHDPRNPIGEWTEIREDARGLFMKGRLWIDGPNPDQFALKAYRAMKAKNGRLGLSIGFRTLDHSFDRTTGIRTLKRVELLEVSPTLFPANSAARVLAAKSDDFNPDEIRDPRSFERMLRDLGFSKSFSAAVTAGGFKAAVGQRDAGDEAALIALLAEIRAGASSLRNLKA